MYKVHCINTFIQSNFNTILIQIKSEIVIFYIFDCIDNISSNVFIKY